MTSVAQDKPPNNTQSRAIAPTVEAIRAFASPCDVVELRIPQVDGRNRTDSGYFDDIEKLAQVAAGYNGRAAGIYITVNEVDPALLARYNNRVEKYAKSTTSDGDIIRLRNFLLDTDPNRPAGISSTDDEKLAAEDVRAAIIEWLLHDLDWPDPHTKGDSGNGAHATWRIDLENTPANVDLIKRCLAALAQHFDTDKVTIDTTVYNPSRIWKLYGTKTGKGDGTADRPNRWARLDHVNENPELVTLAGCRRDSIG